MPTLTTLRRDAAYQIGIFVSGDGTRGIPYRESLATKTVAVVGLAKSGVAAARLLRRLGARVLASDSGARREPRRGGARAGAGRGARCGPAAIPTRPSAGRSWWW